ncbi:MAG TPA: hypothetical protein VFS26_03840 [Solirubrobacterales bacterium]|nr:hypothetical protein [Solirubrobacterales bacterium]
MPRQTRTLECAECGKTFKTTAHNAKFCKRPGCRKAASRRPSKKGRAEAETNQAVEFKVGALLESTLSELNQLQQANSIEGRAAMALAYRIESPLESGSAAASMTKELSRLMAEIRAKAPSKGDGYDDVVGGAAGKLRLVK